jgi:SAM-dependent methyltransferase
MMSDRESTVYQRLAARYASGDLPWDASLPPPEVIMLLEKLPPGRALDLGCGYGRAAIYMSARGWEVDAIDFIPQAIAGAAARAQAAGASVRFHLASVTDLGWLAGPYDLAVDIGCAHSLDEGALASYRDQVARLLRPGGLWLVFARLRQEGEESEEPPGVVEGDFVSLIAGSLTLEWSKRGRTEVGAEAGWPSAWYRFRK